MGNWRATATLWVNDPKKGKMIIGPFGFAWWTKQKVCIGIFDEREDTPLQAFREFIPSKGKVKRYPKESTPNSMVFRFVRHGLLPG